MIYGGNGGGMYWLHACILCHVGLDYYFLFFIFYVFIFYFFALAGMVEFQSICLVLAPMYICILCM